MIKLPTFSSPEINRQTVTTTMVAAANKAATISNLFIVFQAKLATRLMLTEPLLYFSQDLWIHLELGVLPFLGDDAQPAVYASHAGTVWGLVI
ncbi:MAG: hypothetical protein N3E40_01700 [Dehalococcoidia bacterium]|nr:hypothetical protein [Dehalococcoidia bacterium]